LVYLSGQPNTCASTLVAQNKTLIMDIVYFIKDNSLWRRVVAPIGYNTSNVCTIPWQRPSCNPDFMDASPGASSFCKARDIKLVDGVGTTGFTVSYYTNPASTVATSTLSSATTIRATITATQQYAGRTITQTNTIRASKLNAF